MADQYCLAYYGIRIPMTPEEMERLNVPGSGYFEPLFEAGLDMDFNNFSVTGGSDHALLLGHRLGELGGPLDTQAQVSDAELLQIMQGTQAMLKACGFHEAPSLHMLWWVDDATGFRNWMSRVARDCLSIKVGDTREDLYKVYTSAGGISSIGLGERYCHPQSDYIQVEVDFAGDWYGDGFPECSAGDVITRISPPFLASPAYD